MRLLGTGGPRRRGRARLWSGIALVPLAVATNVALTAGAAPSTPIALSTPRSQADPEVPTAGRFIEPVFNEVDVTEDIAYRDAVNVDGDLQTLHLDLYQPAGDTAERRPAVILIHGGFFVLGNNKEDLWGAGPTIAELFARRGYVVASIEYRLRPDMGFFPDVDLAELEAANLDAYDDSVAVVDWLQDHATKYRVDPRAIIPNGPSAGGAVAWNLAWMQGSSARPEPSGVPAAVSISGAPFETSVSTGEPLAAASPGDPPVLAFHGTADDIVAFELAEGPCSRAAAVGVRCDLVPLEGIGHPGLDPEFFDHVGTIERRTFEFLAEVVLAPLGYFDHLSPAPPAEPEPGEAPPAEPEPGEAPPAEPVVSEPAFAG